MISADCGIIIEYFHRTNTITISLCDYEAIGSSITIIKEDYRLIPKDLCFLIFN
jgi:hypothetical protein